MIFMNSKFRVESVKTYHSLKDDKDVQVFIMKRKEDLDMYYAFEPKLLKNIKPGNKSQVIHNSRLKYDSFGNSKDKVASLGAER